MRALLICSLVALAACRTGSLGHCGSDSDCPSGAICDPAAKVCAVPTGGCFPGCASGFSCRNTGCVDDQPPAITGITVLTPPDLPGTVIYRGDDAGTVAVAAQITDPSGVANVCLGVAGESGCPHAGASADGGYWTFTMPRAPSTGTNDGTPVAFTISADDQPDGSVPHHGSASSSILFDNVGPAIQIASDVVAYARLLPDGGTDSLPIQVTIADGSGVCDAGSCAPLLDAGFPNFVSYSAQSGGVFTFNLPATLAAAGKESSLGFTVTAQDRLGHKSSAAGARFVDDAAPGVTLKVWRTEDNEPPGTSGVTAPVSVPNTGYNGSRFLYSDSVHVKGSISDDGGIADVQWRIDGVDPAGGPTTGMAHSICVPGTISCAIDFTVSLNDPTNGAFHTGDARANGPPGTNTVPAGNLSLVVTATDSARTAGGGSNANRNVSPTSLNATRFLWQQAVGANINGLALHPDGDVIVTTQSTPPSSVHAIRPAGVLAQDGGIAWRFGADAGGGTPFGSVVDMPAIGAGDASSAPIYVASSTSGIVAALAPDGGVLWVADAGHAILTAPAVAPVQVNGTPVEEMLVPSSDTSTTSRLLGVYKPAGSPVVASVATDNVDSNSAPLVLNGAVYFGTDTSVTRWTLSNGGFVNEQHGVAGGPFLSLTTDGGVIYAATPAAANSSLLTTFTEATIDAGTTVTVDGGIGYDFIADMNGRTVGSDRSHNVIQVDPATGGVIVLGSSSTNGKTPLQGANGTLYVPRETMFVFALQNQQAIWSFTNPDFLFHAAMIDCNGRLYVAAGPTLYSIITDDPGLADAPWPTYRRDTRATGNFNAPKYGMRLPGPDGGTCDP